MNKFLFVVCLWAATISAETIRVITIEGSTTPSIGILVEPQVVQNSSINPYDVVKFDLEMPGYFNVHPIEQYSATELLQQQAFYYIRLKSEKLTGDSIKVAYEIRDSESGKIAFPGKSYKAKSKEIRRALHLFSKDIVFSILGEQASPDSRLVAVKKSGSRKNIVVMDYDGHRAWGLTSDSHINFLPEWSHDNQAIYYTTFKPRYSTIYHADLVTGRKRQVLPAAYHAYGPKISPDGTAMLFTRQQDQGADIYQFNLAAKKAQRITFGGATETSPEWSPNGFHIAFTSDKGGNPKLYKMSKEGVGAKRLTFEAKSKYLESAAWRPQGDKIAFVGMDSGKLNIYVMNVDGTEVQQLTDQAGNNESPTWSPDGKMIAFSSTRSGTAQIYLMRADGSNVTQITKGPAHSAPRWSK